MIKEDGTHTLGLISDTHGTIRKTALEALQGVELILHAGDVGSLAVLEALEQIAPVAAVHGNTDGAPLRERLPATQAVECGGVLLYLLHELDHLDLDPKAAGIAAVVYGHTHRPAETVRDGVLYVNPGSAGPRRFSNPVTVSRLVIAGSRLETHLVTLEP